MFSFFQGVIGGVASGMLGDRLRKGAERLAHPERELGPNVSEAAEIAEVEQGRKIVANTSDPDNQVRSQIEEVAVLYPYPTLNPIDLRGRHILSMFTATPFTLLIDAPGAGAYSRALTGGAWTELDTPDQSRFGVPATDPVHTVMIRIADKGYGVK